MPAARIAPVGQASSSATTKVNNGHTGCPNGVLDDGLPLIKSSIATSTIKKVPQEPRNIWTRQVFAHSNSPTTGQYYSHCTALSHNVHHEPPYTQASSDDCTSQSYDPIFSQMDTLQHPRTSKRRVHREKGKYVLQLKYSQFQVRHFSDIQLHKLSKYRAEIPSCFLYGFRSPKAQHSRLD